MTATPRDPMTPLRLRKADDDQTDAEARNASGPNRRQANDATPQAPDLAPEPPLRAARTVGGDQLPGRRGGPSFAAAMVDILPVLPTIGAIATVFAYIGGPTWLAGLLHLTPLLTGAVAALTVGLIMAACHRPFFTSPDRAHTQSFAELRQRLDSLANQLRVLGRRASTSPVELERIAIGEATAHHHAIERDLERGGPQWIIGTGYVDAIVRLHRAEEAIILVQPVEDVWASALFDELRIEGSTMPERDRLLGKLRPAIRALSPTATAYLTETGRLPGGAVGPGVTPDGQAATARPAQDGHAVSVVETPAAGPDAAAANTTSPAAIEARIIVREIRRTINDFRDESRARLIRSRCRLLGTMTVTGLITYVLLAFAVAMSPQRTVLIGDPITAAAAIYLVGAVVGLFNRLHVESGDDTAYEEYGLSKTRLLLTPMLSGLAAVGGVMVVGMLSGIVDISVITPVQSVSMVPPTPTTVPDSVQLPRTTLALRDVFSLEKYPLALVLAAVFGLMPKTFLERLREASQQSRLDLRSTAATR